MHANQLQWYLVSLLISKRLHGQIHPANYETNTQIFIDLQVSFCYYSRRNSCQWNSEIALRHQHWRQIIQNVKFAVELLIMAEGETVLLRFIYKQIEIRLHNGMDLNVENWIQWEYQDNYSLNNYDRPKTNMNME